ncbi:hypothetical protein [Candidatus Magnetaquicoccus inordinatus]
MVVIVAQEDAQQAIEGLQQAGEEAWLAGEVRARHSADEPAVFLI